MAAGYNQILVGYTDKNGKQATNFWTSLDQDPGVAGALADLAVAIQNCTDAAVSWVQYQATLHLDGEAADGPYCTVYDRAAVMASIPETGQPLVVGIVAPKAELFEADTVTVDMTNVNLLALQDEMMPLVGDRTGHAMGPFQYGERSTARGVS